MPENARMWVEISFNVVYLIGVWGLVFAMIAHRERVADADGPVAARIVWAFGLLALGDSGHVGFRVLAYALGGLEAQPLLFGLPISLVGMGALATAITVTFFYVLMLDAWRLRFAKPWSWFTAILLAAAVIRLLVMALPANEWSRVVPPQPWSTLRNLPLMVLGLGVAYLILRDARAANDRAFFWIGTMILVSYACYVPVVFFVQQAPLLGMLMIPKTLAYVAIAFIAYNELWTGKQPSQASRSVWAA